jgi:hypothetical protein
MKELGKPKRPLSAFLLFMKDKKNERGTQSFRVSICIQHRNTVKNLFNLFASLTFVTQFG